ncbi:MAG: AzlD domain-containing protein [Burkholderiaceae bacterium]
MIPAYDAWLAIGLLGLVSYFSRVAGVTLAQWIPQTSFWQRFFATLPSTLLVAIATPSFVSGEIDLIAGAVVTLGLAIRKLNLIVAMSGGVIVVALIRLLL